MAACASLLETWPSLAYMDPYSDLKRVESLLMRTLGFRKPLSCFLLGSYRWFTAWCRWFCSHASHCMSPNASGYVLGRVDIQTGDAGLSAVSPQLTPLAHILQNRRPSYPDLVIATPRPPRRLCGPKVIKSFKTFSQDRKRI